MSISDETVILKQYAAVIKALIPYQQNNRLLEGLNKLSPRLSTRVRRIIKEEVIRLTALTDASADNSEFAVFPVAKFKHFGISMRLDRVGRDILQRETQRYADRYTVGVFESVMNSEYYQSQIKQEQQQKIINAFMVETQSFDDINFANDLAIRPNFTVSCPQYEKGKHVTVASLSSSQLILETKRMPAIEGDEKLLTFVFPEVSGLVTKDEKFDYVVDTLRFNRETNKFETVLSLTGSSAHRVSNKIADYLSANMYKQPLQRELEIERAMQDLERDRVLCYSPWVTVFIKTNENDAVPEFALMTKANMAANENFKLLQQLPSGNIFKRMLKELDKHGELFLLKGTLQTKGEPVTVAASLRELTSLQLLHQFVAMLTESGDYLFLQCRSATVKQSEVNTAMDIHDIISTDYPELHALTHIVYCRELTKWGGKLHFQEKQPRKPFPKAIVEDTPAWNIKVIMEDNLDRRSEPRYLINRPASIKQGLFSSLEGVVNDISQSGLKFTLNAPLSEYKESTVKITIPDLKVKNETYHVIAYNADSGMFRLSISSSVSTPKNSKIASVVESNQGFFKQRDITVHQRKIHRFLWELAARNLPSTAVLTTHNRFILDRLKTVYTAANSKDLAPFAMLENKAMLHGVFADKRATKPSSPLLEEIFKKRQHNTHIIHAIRRKDKRIIYVPERDYLYGKVREQIRQRSLKDEIEVIVTQVDAVICDDAITPLTNKRLAQLSKIDADAYEKLQKAQQAYTHVLHIFNVSALHTELMRQGLFPIEEEHSQDRLHNAKTQLERIKNTHT